MDPYFSLGPYARSISTRSDEAQTWFNRGLNWCYAFHHKEAVRCFQKVVELDPDCAMGIGASPMEPGLTTTSLGARCRRRAGRWRSKPPIRTRAKRLDTSKNSDFGSLRHDLTVPARLTVVFPGVFALA